METSKHPKSYVDWLLPKLTMCLMLAVFSWAMVGIYARLQRHKGWDQAETEGKEFGKNANYQACYEFSLTRHQSSFMQRDNIFKDVFLGACLRNSKPVESFCAQFPNQSPYSNHDSDEWLNVFCENKSLNKIKCVELTKQTWQICRESAGLRN